MNAGESIGFGTQICLDGAKADVEALADVELARRVIAELAAAVEGSNPGAAPEGVVVLDLQREGHSAALVVGETSVSLHSFPSVRAVTLKFFSVRDLPLGRTTKLFLEAYGVGRYQSAVSGRSLLVPRDPDRLRLALAGERDYTWLRVVPAERVTL
ncbi:MAG: hypothetical protein WC972_03180 [Trueperaceae bacterium]|nr:S-adenosylmethionine decarboxylase [Trueperaceae bacterium]